MNKSRFSDFSEKKSRDEQIILIQPKLTPKPAKAEIGRWDDSTLDAVFKSTLSLDMLVHTGFLICDMFNYKHDKMGMPVYFDYCGGDLRITKIKQHTQHDDFLKELGGYSELAITCSNPKCEMLLGTKFSKIELRNVLLHLMLKQMIPNLATCNYVDCSGLREGDLLPERDYKSIRALGLVSVISESMWGKFKSEHFTIIRGEHASLGFTLKPGINSANSCDGLDNWLKFLVCKKFSQLKELIDRSGFSLLGPKPESS
jgi:hypothetical protein